MDEFILIPDNTVDSGEICLHQSHFLALFPEQVNNPHNHKVRLNFIHDMGQPSTWAIFTASTRPHVQKGDIHIHHSRIPDGCWLGTLSLLNVLQPPTLDDKLLKITSPSLTASRNNATMTPAQSMSSPSASENQNTFANTSMDTRSVKAIGGVVEKITAPAISPVYSENVSNNNSHTDSNTTTSSKHDFSNSTHSTIPIENSDILFFPHNPDFPDFDMEDESENPPVSNLSRSQSREPSSSVVHALLDSDEELRDCFSKRKNIRRRVALSDLLEISDDSQDIVTLTTTSSGIAGNTQKNVNPTSHLVIEESDDNSQDISQTHEQRVGALASRRKRARHFLGDSDEENDNIPSISHKPLLGRTTTTSLPAEQTSNMSLSALTVAPTTAITTAGSGNNENNNGDNNSSNSGDNNSSSSRNLSISSSSDSFTRFSRFSQRIQAKISELRHQQQPNSNLPPSSTNSNSPSAPRLSSPVPSASLVADVSAVPVVREPCALLMFTGETCQDPLCQQTHEICFDQLFFSCSEPCGRVHLSPEVKQAWIEANPLVVAEQRPLAEQRRDAARHNPLHRTNTAQRQEESDMIFARELQRQLEQEEAEERMRNHPQTRFRYYSAGNYGEITYGITPTNPQGTTRRLRLFSRNHRAIGFLIPQDLHEYVDHLQHDHRANGDSAVAFRHVQYETLDARVAPGLAGPPANAAVIDQVPLENEDEDDSSYRGESDFSDVEYNSDMDESYEDEDSDDDRAYRFNAFGGMLIRMIAGAAYFNQEPLSKAQIQRLVVEHTVTDKDTAIINGEPCVVCLCSFVVSDETTMLPCFHRFHSGCVQDWLQRELGNPTCPTCRLPLQQGAHNSNAGFQ